MFEVIVSYPVHTISVSTVHSRAENGPAFFLDELHGNIPACLEARTTAGKAAIVARARLTKLTGSFMRSIIVCNVSGPLAAARAQEASVFEIQIH